VIRSSSAISVHDASAVAEVRRAVSQSAERAGLSANAVARAALAATELATNLVKHSGGGSILFGADESGAKAITLTSIDKGSGITNVQSALRDGYSTAGSSGTGLGAVKRAAVFFDVYSDGKSGTALVCRIADEEARPIDKFSIAGICIPVQGEEESGDSWSATVSGDVATMSVVDGLGHGPAAASASRAGIRVVKEHPDRELPALMQDAHAALRPTRGAAMAIARVRTAEGEVQFAGVGNIAGSIALNGSLRKTVSFPGTVGHEMRKVQLFSYPWQPGSILIMHSDGLSGSWSLETYPGLSERAPAVIAAVLFRDFCRGKDDATIVVAKAT
jgi:anti-sigma regulatory factor (Ser/Thr protein kinase)